MYHPLPHRHADFSQSGHSSSNSIHPRGHLFSQPMPLVLFCLWNKSDPRRVQYSAYLVSWAMVILYPTYPILFWFSWIIGSTPKIHFLEFYHKKKCQEQFHALTPEWHVNPLTWVLPHHWFFPSSLLLPALPNSWIKHRDFDLAFW